MYGKFFASTFEGSMMGAGADVFAVWGYVIANTVDSVVELNSRLVGFKLGVPEDRIEGAIEWLCSPDPRSKNPALEGRRLTREGQFQYRVTSHEHYRNIRNEDERRAYNRAAQQKSREKRKSHGVSLTGQRGQRTSAPSAHAEAERDPDLGAALAAAKGADAPATKIQAPEFRLRSPDPSPASDPKDLSGSARAKRPKRGPLWHFVPADWAIKPAHRTLALGLILDVEHQAELFRAHEFREPRSDADRAFTGWLRRATEFGSRPVARNDPGGLAARARRLADDEARTFDATGESK